MPLWLTIVIAVIGLISTILGILGVSAYISERAKHRASKKNQQEDELEEKKEEEQEALREMEHRKYVEELREVINEAIDPLKKDVSQIKTDLAKNTEGTVTLLRTDMKNALDRYKDRGFASAGDRANWMELYNTYDKLGGNHFKEYVDGWKEELLDLPFKKATKKKVLKENK